MGGYRIDVGDIFSHEKFYSMGRKGYFNETKNLEISVYVQNICDSFNQAKEQCFK